MSFSALQKIKPEEMKRWASVSSSLFETERMGKTLDVWRIMPSGATSCKKLFAIQPPIAVRQNKMVNLYVLRYKGEVQFNVVSIQMIKKKKVFKLLLIIWHNGIIYHKNNMRLNPDPCGMPHDYGVIRANIAKEEAKSKVHVVWSHFTPAS